MLYTQQCQAKLQNRRRFSLARLCFSPGCIISDHWTIAGQDEGEWRRAAEQGAKRFMAKLIAAEKPRAGLRQVTW